MHNNLKEKDAEIDEQSYEEEYDEDGVPLDHQYQTELDFVKQLEVQRRVFEEQEFIRVPGQKKLLIRTFLCGLCPPFLDANIADRITSFGFPSTCIIKRPLGRSS